MKKVLVPIELLEWVEEQRSRLTAMRGILAEMVDDEENTARGDLMWLAKIWPKKEASKWLKRKIKKQLRI